MQPHDFEPGQDPGDWEEAYLQWIADGNQLRTEQSTLRDELEAQLAARGRLQTELAAATTLRDTLIGLQRTATELQDRIRNDTGAAADLATRIGELQQARDLATSRLLGDHEHTTPAILLPVRIETRWLPTELRVRIIPDDIHVDSHEPELTADEANWSARWWDTDPSGRRPLWDPLVERFGGRRAAWIITLTDPTSNDTPGTRDAVWTRAPCAPTLPDRWAIVGIVGDEPVVTAWSRPIPDRLAVGVSPEHGISEAAANDWLVDFDRAVDVGMAVTIPTPAAMRDRGLDALVVIGLKSTGTEATNRLGALLDAHHYTRGLGLLGAGTPTNNTPTGRAAFSPNPDRDLLYRLTTGPDVTDDHHAGPRLARLLGVDAAVLGRVEAADARDDLDADAMRAAVASASGNLVRRLADQAGAAATAAVWNSAVPGGAVPTLRVGTQPYGVLTATALTRWVPEGDDAHATVAAALQRAWPSWRTLARSGRARRSWFDPLMEILAEHPASIRYALNEQTVLAGIGATVGAPGPDGRPAEPYLRTIVDATPEQLRTPSGAGQVAIPPILLARLAAWTKHNVAPAGRAELDALLTHLDGLPAARLHDLLAETLDGLSHRVDAWITAVAHGRLDQLRTTRRHDLLLGGYGVVLDVRPRPGPQSTGFVHAPSLAQAATTAVLRSAFLAERERHPTGQVAAAPLAVDLSSDRVRKALWLLDGIRHGQPLGALLGYRFERRLADVGQQRYISGFRKLVGFHGDDTLALLRVARENASTARQVAWSEHQQRLGEVATAKATVDAAENSLITRGNERDTFQQSHVEPLEDHERALTVAEQAVLKAREALAAHDGIKPLPEDDGDDIEAPDGRRHVTKPRPFLSPELVTWSNQREPLRRQLVAAVAGRDRAAALVQAEAPTLRANRAALAALNRAIEDAGDHLETILRAEFARAVADRDSASTALTDAEIAETDAIDDLTDELRRQWRDATTTTAVTAVVDGLELSRRYRLADPTGPRPRWDGTTIPFSAAGDPAGIGVELPHPGDPASGFADVVAALHDLDDHVDAVSDLLLAEGVHQFVHGNPARAGAALDTVASGHVPNEIDVIRTPRHGADGIHRLVVVVDPDQPATWVPTHPTVRGAAEPALESFASRLLPDPALASCTVTITESNNGTRLRSFPQTVTLDRLGLGALDHIYLAEPGDGAQHGELEQRLADYVRNVWFSTTDPATSAWIDPSHLGIEIDLDPSVSAGQLTANEHLATAAALRDLLAAARPLGPADLAAPSSVVDPAVDVDDLAGRVSQVRVAIIDLLTALKAASELRGPDVLCAALFQAASLGVAGAVPPILAEPGAVDVDLLLAQADSTGRVLRARLKEHDGVAIPDSPAGSPVADQRATALLARASCLLGRQLRVVPRFSAPLDPAATNDLGQTLNTRLGITRPAQLRRWLAQRGAVRPAIQRFLTACDHTEIIGHAPLRLGLTQLPLRTDDRWIGLPSQSPDPGRLSLIAHTIGPIPAGAWCGLVIDDWTETVPDASQTTGVAYHFDQPNSEPAQVILIAVPPDRRSNRTPTAWDLDTLTETIIDTVDLAQLRAIAPERLGDPLPPGVILPPALITAGELNPT